jgi:hypothetical protein
MSCRVFLLTSHLPAWVNFLREWAVQGFIDLGVTKSLVWSVEQLKVAYWWKPQVILA